jgi:aspartate kinase
MKVFKFGGASVSNSEKIINVASILKKYRHEKLLIVVSAMGKTTNALEKVAEAFYSHNKELALSLFEKVKAEHDAKAIQLLQKPLPALINFYTEVEWLLHDKPVREYDYYYDQIVCAGELISTVIVSEFLNENGIRNNWMDVRDIIRTDNTFRDARIDWKITEERINQQIKPLYSTSDIVLTQGFIGSTDENESTTLGREGSDYTAAVFANLLRAESQTIWKDVPGVMNADPKQYKEAQWIRELNYQEVIEMAYYGAQVIHPKTIKPLQNKNIPLYVRSFVHPDEEGTIIHNESVHDLPPIIVYKEKQVLVQFNTKDFSFISEGPSVMINQAFETGKIRPNLTQMAAISMLCVIDENGDKMDHLLGSLTELFDILIIKNLTLLTIRHYTQKMVNELCNDKKIILQQQTPETIQVLMNASS